MNTKRTHIVIPQQLVAEIDALVGKRGRSTFVTQAAEKEVMRLCQLRAVEAAAGMDSLRLEMCYPLNGSDLSIERNPIEAGLGFFVDLEKGEFTGRDKLLETKTKGARERLVAFKMNGKGPPPRPHYALFSNGKRVGEISSGTLSPSLNIGIGMGYVSAASAKIGTPLEVEIRGQKFPATIEKKPLYKKLS